MGALSRHFWAMDQIRHLLTQEVADKLDIELAHFASKLGVKRSHIPLMLDSCIYPMVRYRFWLKQDLLKEFICHRWRVNWNWSESEAVFLWGGLCHFMDTNLALVPNKYFTGNSSRLLRFIILTVMSEKNMDGDFVHRVGLGTDILRRIQKLVGRSAASESGVQVYLADSMDAKIHQEFEFIASNPCLSVWGSQFWLAMYQLHGLPYGLFVRLVDESFGSLASGFLSLISGSKTFTVNHWQDTCREFLPWLDSVDLQIKLKQECLACGWMIQVEVGRYCASDKLLCWLTDGFTNLVVHSGDFNLSGVESLPDIWLEALLDRDGFKSDRKPIEQVLFARHTRRPDLIFHKHRLQQPSQKSSK